MLSAATALKRSGRVRAPARRRWRPSHDRNDHSGRRAQGIEDADHVSYEMQDRVLVDPLRRVTLAVAAQVGGDNTEAGSSKGVDLMPPGEPGFREAVHEQHQRPVALLGNVDVDPVAFDDPLRCLAHFSISLRSCRKCL